MSNKREHSPGGLTDDQKFIASLQQSIVDHEKRIRALEKLAKEGEQKFTKLVNEWNRQQKAFRKLR